MAGTSAAIGDNGRSFFHDRFPVRVGHVGYQHVAGLNAVHFADIVDDLHRPCANAVADCPAFNHHFALVMKRIALHDLAPGTHGFRAGLHNIELAGMAIFGPLDIHRATVVLLDQHRLLRQRLDLIIGQREQIAIGLWHVFNTHLLAVLLAWGVDHADLF